MHGTSYKSSYLRPKSVASEAGVRKKPFLLEGHLRIDHQFKRVQETSGN